MNSDTPRTDAVKFVVDIFEDGYHKRYQTVATVEHAEQLERENQQLHLQYLGINVECESHVKEIKQLRANLKQSDRLNTLAYHSVITHCLSSDEIIEFTVLIQNWKREFDNQASVQASLKEHNEH